MHITLEIRTCRTNLVIFLKTNLKYFTLKNVFKIFASFSSVGFGSYTIHGFCQSCVSFHGDGTEAHGTWIDNLFNYFSSTKNSTIAIPPVTNLLTISEASWTSSMLTDASEVTSSSWPRSVQ